MLFKLSRLIMLAFILFASKQVFAHVDHSFFNEQSSRYNQSFFDEGFNAKNASTEKKSLRQTSFIDVKQAKIIFPFEIDSVILQQRIVFQNHMLLSQLNYDKNQEKEAFQQTEDDCNCLNDCSCLECQCADCPMSVGCGAASVVLLNDIITSVQPTHENLVSTTNDYFNSQPHTLPFRPPITL
ncbi:MAG: hypothetical protein COB35_01370 [Gammaproteobacteria bacterium]|nr:MAG: hypothetical protein COB35_01370 [Gammaproteobacteria bacterium]